MRLSTLREAAANRGRKYGCDGPGLGRPSKRSAVERHVALVNRIVGLRRDRRLRGRDRRTRRCRHRGGHRARRNGWNSARLHRQRRLVRGNSVGGHRDRRLKGPGRAPVDDRVDLRRCGARGKREGDHNAASPNKARLAGLAEGARFVAVVAEAAMTGSEHDWAYARRRRKIFSTDCFGIQSYKRLIRPTRRRADTCITH
jgi:hypothetical protein